MRANSTITFGQNAPIDAEAVAHEASHVADQQELASAFHKAVENGNTLVDPRYLPENITKRNTEARAYRVSEAIAQGLNRASKSYGDYEIWNNGWREADRSARMQSGIKSVLTNSSLYKNKLSNNRLYGDGFAFGNKGEWIRHGPYPSMR